MKVSYETIWARSAAWPCSFLVMLTLSGCTVGPNFTQPESSLAPTWQAPVENGLSAEETDPQVLASWWTTLNDPVLSSLIERAVKGNLDLRNARSRIRQARATRAASQGAFFPIFDTTDSATWSRSSKDTGTGRSSETYSLALDAGWEMDLFGGLRRSEEAAQASLQASEEDLRDVLVSLLAETALNYVEVRAYQSRLAAAQTSLETQNETYQLTVWRYQAGLGDELAVQQARYNLENTRSQIPTLRSGLDQAMNHIAVLLGIEPGRIRAELEAPGPVPVPPSNVAVGVPADVVRRRPDIRRAEYQLAAQTARVGVATADLYPKLTLNGSISTNLASLGDLSSANWIASGGPRASWDFFNATVRPNIEVQTALQEQALIDYQVAVLSALEEVENALVTYVQEQYRRDSLSVATDAARQAASLAQNEYQAGLADFTTVLDAQRSLLSFQDQLIQSNATVTSALIRLYKALGGGWTPAALASTTPQAMNQF
jgi:NodT family efflux transporter outer membrane factor (OMF) lipoprotein